jgi:hypothetical protein
MQDTETERRAATLQKYAPRVVPRHEPEVQEALDAYKDARAYVREALMLDIRLVNGEVESFDYASLRRVRFVPGDTLLLTFGDITVTVEGRNLGQIRDAISEHRRRYIHEGMEAESATKPEDAAHIERIMIVEGENEL